MRLEQFYQEVILDHYKHPQHRGLREPDEVAGAAEIAGDRHGLEHLQLAQRDIHAAES